MLYSTGLLIYAYSVAINDRWTTSSNNDFTDKINKYIEFFNIDL